MGGVPPIVEELRPAPDPVDVFRRLCRLPHCAFFDSAMRHPVVGRYSFVCADPWEYLEVPLGGGDALAELEHRLRRWQDEVVPLPELPPFQAGAAGLLSYDLGRQLERLPEPRFDEFQLPALAVGLYDVVVAVDHRQDRAWILSHGLPDRGPRRLARARQRLDQMRRWLAGEAGPSRVQESPAAARPSAPSYSVPGAMGLLSNFSAAGYLEAVRRAVEYIYAGDVFQVNLAQRLLLAERDDPAALYLRLRQCNPAPFAGYFDLGEWQVVSASPERFLSLGGGRVEARPIKGTRRRPADPRAESASEKALRESPKDRAENVMIVDLLRNDLSRVCQPDSVEVTQLCGLETYAYVQHLVSVVRGRLGDDLGPVDLVRAAFPGGSVTGAPKVRAMEIIAQLEPTARGPYCGSLGYFGFDGRMDLSILIRTITAGRGWWQAPVGGGIVAQSIPEQEYEETWAKAEGLLRAMR
jgi:para-aminobenzoate synthetase component 1